MNKRLTGAVFCLIAAMLYCCRYICAAIYMAGLSTWSSDYGLENVSNSFTVFACVALAAGIFYLVRAEIEDRKSDRDGKTDNTTV